LYRPGGISSQADTGGCGADCGFDVDGVNALDSRHAAANPGRMKAEGRSAHITSMSGVIVRRQRPREYVADPKVSTHSVAPVGEKALDVDRTLRIVSPFIDAPGARDI
jgi:hypothetical protein